MKPIFTQAILMTSIILPVCLPACTTDVVEFDEPTRPPVFDEVPVVEPTLPCVPGVLCRPAIGACDEPEFCSDEGRCPPDLILAEGEEPNPVNDIFCERGETCSGVDAHCSCEG